MKRAKHLRRRRWPVVCAALLASATAAAGVAYAAIPDGSGVFTACEQTSNGSVRLIDPSLGSDSRLGHCTAQETQVSWNEQGPTGPQGPTGAQGTPGADGAAAGFSAASTGWTDLGIFSTQVASVELPAGKYVVTGTANLQNSGVGVDGTSCYLSADAGATVFAQAVSTVPQGPEPGIGNGFSDLTLVGSTTLADAGSVTVLCAAEGAPTSARASLTAVQVATLN